MLASTRSEVGDSARNTTAATERPRFMREQDQYMPIANVIRIMRRILPPHAKISDDAKETIQECVSEYISFITSEANERCHREQRKTITAEDVLWAMGRLGFDNYINPLIVFLNRYREAETVRTTVSGEPSVKRTVDFGSGNYGVGCRVCMPFFFWLQSGMLFQFVESLEDARSWKPLKHHQPTASTPPQALLPEQDQYMPIANEQRKTITAEDVIWATGRLSFENYIEPLTVFLNGYCRAETERTCVCGEPFVKHTGFWNAQGNKLRASYSHWGPPCWGIFYAAGMNAMKGSGAGAGGSSSRTAKANFDPFAQVK
ncbi:hypothetical protein F0562_008703 [Nyssa sinensis]|uniref:Transcription factor CBF/NF-Y/archaeal histone domain-containing protein n=1 Tax=Nyssa sinensis TaxID=561372 RepID=A0A5J5AAL7_9ASTE|nr:hypothetical protein F0562_008703 [Nyssa sinensis]